MNLVFYDFVAPLYDAVLEDIYYPFRARALALLPFMGGATVLDLACGTGQNFSFLAKRIGSEGKIIGVDASSGMLRLAERRAGRTSLAKVTLIRSDAARLSSSMLEAQTGLSSVDFVICTYGFTSMHHWEAAFWSSWNLLKPGGGYLIHDIHAEVKNFHAFAVEWATRSDFSQATWSSLQSEALDFRMDYIDPSAHLFGGRLFVAYGTKPPLTAT